MGYLTNTITAYSAALQLVVGTAAQWSATGKQEQAISSLINLTASQSPQTATCGYLTNKITAYSAALKLAAGAASPSRATQKISEDIRLASPCSSKLDDMAAVSVSQAAGASSHAMCMQSSRDPQRSWHPVHGQWQLARFQSLCISQSEDDM